VQPAEGSIVAVEATNGEQVAIVFAREALMQWQLLDNAARSSLGTSLTALCEGFPPAGLHRYPDTGWMDFPVAKLNVLFLELTAESRELITQVLPQSGFDPVAPSLKRVVGSQCLIERAYLIARIGEAV
jgi:hypothetical protein